MVKIVSKTLGIALLLGVTASAQQTVQSNTTTSKPNVVDAVPMGRNADPAGQLVNIRLDLTIADQMTSGEPAKKVVTMMVADRSNGSIRSTGNVERQGPVRINVDARPHILPNGNIRVTLGLEYSPAASTGSVAALNEQLTVILEPGKPLLLSQAADPMSERKISVEIRAAIAK